MTDTTGFNWSDSKTVCQRSDLFPDLFLMTFEIIKRFQAVITFVHGFTGGRAKLTNHLRVF